MILSFLPLSKSTAMCGFPSYVCSMSDNDRLKAASSLYNALLLARHASEKLGVGKGNSSFKAPSPHDTLVLRAIEALERAQLPPFHS
jgi:hypothetical protein